MPHRETSGNQEYNFVSSGGEDDGPYTEAGLPVVDLGFVAPAGGDDGDTATPTETETVDDAAADPFASVDFSNQAIEDAAATVGEAVLSEGGFVTLHDARLLTGEPLESVVGVSEYLDPGRHRNVEVEIDTPGEITEVALPAPPLVPMPHLDTNGNQEYDFVATEGAEDAPYTRAGQAVVDLGLVTLEDGGDDDDDDATMTAADA
jgi:hypothetical protein